jgi:hypothetical protein
MAQALAYEKAVLEVRAMAQKQLEIDPPCGLKLG